MPTLNWIGKEKVVNHHLDVPFRTLEKQYTYASEGQDDGGNMIIHGDNLDALKALLPQFEGQIDCIYIDPPYNTGNESEQWSYNDNVNDPHIVQWLGDVVGPEGEDLCRHDKWLCMMYPRLKLLHKLLAETGVIFISIDDNELHNLRTICNDIFGISNFVANIVWQKTYSPRNDSKKIPYETDSILVYRKSEKWIPNKLERTAEMNARYKSPDGDPIPWKSGDASAAGAADHQGMVYAIQHPITGRFLYPPQGRHWKDEQSAILTVMNMWANYELVEIDDINERARVCNISPNEVRLGVKAIVLADSVEHSREIAQNRYDQGNWPEYYFTSGGKGGIAFKVHAKEDSGRSVTNLWPYSEVGHTDEATKELKGIFDGISPFNTPKPTRLLERILQVATSPDSIILDSFAGSATTAHAVLKANRRDQGNRRFILVEMMPYAESLTAERVKRAISGYSKDAEVVLFDQEITVKNLSEGEELLAEARRIARESKVQYKSVKNPQIHEGHLQVVAIEEQQEGGLSGGFSFYELGEPLLQDGLLNPNVPVEKIREYVYYTETKAALPTPSDTEKYLLGVHDHHAYYFYYEPDQLTTLNRSFLRTIQTKAEGYLIYADVNALSQEDMERFRITFKKIPRDIALL